MPAKRSAKIEPENAARIEPALLETVPPRIADLVADISTESAILANAPLHPRTAASLTRLVQIMNAYYSNLIEGHNTRPADIARALAGELDRDEGRRNLQLEAAAHVRVQAEVDRMAAEASIPEPTSTDFIRWLHREFYRDVPVAMLHVRPLDPVYVMRPGEWRSSSADDVVVGRHQPPSSERVPEFMRYFERRYALAGIGKAARIVAMAAAHHRLNYIHPFPDGNGRVSRLMSHAMAHEAGIGAHGLWSVSRGLARGLGGGGDYKRMMDHADSPRRSDIDGRGNLSLAALVDFITWFFEICLDQIRFMSAAFELAQLTRRLLVFVERDDRLRPEAARLLEEAALRGEFERGRVPDITGLPERTARRVLDDTIYAGLHASDTPKGPLSLRFPPDVAEVLFPRLF